MNEKRNTASCWNVHGERAKGRTVAVQWFGWNSSVLGNPSATDRRPFSDVQNFEIDSGIFFIFLYAFECTHFGWI